MRSRPMRATPGAATGYDRSRRQSVDAPAAAGPLGQTIAAAADGLWLMGFDGVVRQCGAWAADEFKRRIPMSPRL